MKEKEPHLTNPLKGHLHQAVKEGRAVPSESAATREASIAHPLKMAAAATRQAVASGGDYGGRR